MAQSILSTLTTSDVVIGKVRVEEDPIVRYRATLDQALQHNLKCAEAMLAKQKDPNAPGYVAERMQVVIDPTTKKPLEEDGKRVKKMLPIKRWEPAFGERDGAWYCQAKIANFALKIGDGVSVKVKSLKDVPGVYKKLAEANNGGEFDEQMKKKYASRSKKKK